MNCAFDASDDMLRAGTGKFRVPVAEYVCEVSDVFNSHIAPLHPRIPLPCDLGGTSILNGAGSPEISAELHTLRGDCRNVGRNNI
jgi:hypothetical protein